MRFYTVLCDGKEIVAAAGNNGNLYGLESLGVQAERMNALIDKWGQVSEQLKSALEKLDKFGFF